MPPGKNQLCRAGAGDNVLAATKFNHEKLVWRCRLCLLMPDHLHAIIAFLHEPGMEGTVTNWKKFLAGRYGVNWQRDFFDHGLRNHHEVDENQLHSDESCSQSIVRMSGGLGCGFIVRMTGHRY